MQKLTMEQAVVVSAYTGFMVCPFPAMHAEIEKRFGGPVWTHQFANREFVDEKIKPLFKDDFISMVPSSNAGAEAQRRLGPDVGQEVRL